MNSVGIEVLSKPFLSEGYLEKGECHFVEKKLYAKHYEHPTAKNAPLIFISELLVDEFSSFLVNTVDSIISKIPKHLQSNESLIFSGTVWG